MSGAERSYRFALLAFPKQYREERGEEIVATVLEGGDGRCPRPREFFGLFWAGVAQRSLRAGGERTAGSVRAGLRLGAYFYFWVVAVFSVEATLRTRANPGFLVHYEISAASSAAIGLVVLLALSRGWWTAPLGFAVAWLITDRLFLGLFLDSSSPWPWYWTLVSVTFGLLPALLCVLARPRRREPRDLRSPLWAIAALVLGALMAWHATSWLEWQLLLVVPPIVWLVLGWRDLRLAIALATVAMYLGSVPYLTLIGTGGRRVGTFAVMELVILAIAVVPIAIGFAGRRLRT